MGELGLPAQWGLGPDPGLPLQGSSQPMSTAPGGRAGALLLGIAVRSSPSLGVMRGPAAIQLCISRHSHAPVAAPSGQRVNEWQF